MALTRGEVLSLVKRLLRESNTINLTYSTDELNEYFYEALKSAVKECKWPEQFATATWPADEDEVTLPDGLIEVSRVYLNGQRIRSTNIPILEGDYRRVYDASWTVEDSVTVPALQSSSDTPLTLLGTPDVKYYIRGKVIGFTPKPSAEYTIKLHALFEPPDPFTDNVELWFFDANKDYLVYKTLQYCFLTDRKFKEADYYRSLAQEQVYELRRQIKNLQGDDETHVNPLPYREHWGR